MENKDHTVRTVLISNRKIVETDPKWIPHKHTYIHSHPLSYIGTGTSIKRSGGVKLNLYVQNLPS